MDRTHRRIVLAVIAAVILASGLVVYWQSRPEKVRIAPGVTEALYPRLVPGLCAVQSWAAAGNRNQAAVVFYDDVHQGLHVLDAQILGAHRELAGRLRQAKTRIEQDLSTFAPDLGAHVAPVLSVTREALRAAGRADDRVCADLPTPTTAGPTRPGPTAAVPVPAP